jgi:ABC-2 type transport system permease protein
VRRTLLVARREFLATVMTKGFVVGVLLLPLVMLFIMMLVPLLVSIKPPKVTGTVAVIDRSGGVMPILTTKIDPAAIAESLRRESQRNMERAGRMVGDFFGAERSGQAMEFASKHAKDFRDAPEIRLEALAADADVEAAKAPLREGTAHDKRRLALIVIEEGALTPVVQEGREVADPPYQAYMRTMLDERVQRLILDSVADAIGDARVSRLGLKPEDVRGLLDIPHVAARTVTAAGERPNISGMQYIVPVAFMLLLMISSFTGGQYLLTTTIEEKSNRIMEVLLSAVSPKELMIGKIIGQMGVGLLILLIYSGLGLGALLMFQLLDTLSAANLAYLLVFFFIAFFLIASIMAAVGSAVTEIHEAQSLVGTFMLVFLVPWLLMPAIVQNPNSTMSTVLSMTPPVCPFVMVARIAASTTPVPLWQVAVSILSGLLAVVVAAWAAAKIFRIGVLMYGKPPNIATLLRWIRMA